MIKNKQLMADMLLVIVTLAWGISYILIDVSLTEVGPMTLNALRFLGSVFFLVAILNKRLAINKKLIIYSFGIGTMLFITYCGATYGVLFTSLSNVGFLISLPVVFTPILSYVFFKTVPEKKFVLVIIMATIGIAFMTLTGDLHFGFGDFICIVAAVAYTFDLILTEIALKNAEIKAVSLGVGLMCVTGIYALVFALIFEEPHLPQTPKVWGAVIFLALFCTALAFVFQPIAQQYTSSSHVGVIFTLEPVFAGIAAYFIAKEVLTPMAYLGACLLILSMFIMEIDFKKICIKIIQYFS